MPMTYRRPGVYLTESLLVNPADVGAAVTVSCFVGVTQKGPVNEPVLVQSWSDFVQLFGNLDPIKPPAPPDPNDASAAVLGGSTFADLPTLKADPDKGDGHYAGVAMTAGQYVLLEDKSRAHVEGTAGTSVWEAGPFDGDPLPYTVPPKVLSYLPFSVYSFFQNGGRQAWIIRAAPTTAPDKGSQSQTIVNGALQQDPLQSFIIKARSPGAWGDGLKYELVTNVPGAETVFSLRVWVRNSEGSFEPVETFTALSVKGEIAGTRKVDTVINDPAAGSRYITVTGLNQDQPAPAATTAPVQLTGGVDPSIPDAGELQAAAGLVSKVEGPVALNIVGYLNDAAQENGDQYAESWVGTTIASSSFDEREDIFIVNDSAPPRKSGVESSVYKNTIMTSLGVNAPDSYSASYGPWIIIPHPAKVGSTIAVPPGGGVIGMMARIDATVGVFRAPAGVIAGISNAVGVQTKFTDSELGDLNASNINIIRSVVGAGICCMGGRTRKPYGVDKYVSARRTLIYIKEVLRRSTQFAVFENNDHHLWSSLRMSADRILRPLWEAGGLAGANTQQAYFIRCDDTINTPQVVASGEVRMEIGVALQYPAEFVIIRITQYDRGSFTSEVQPV